MNEEQDLKLTDLDYLIGNHHLQMMKAALPFMEVPEQKMMSVFVKFKELQRTISLFDQEEVASLGICSAGSAPEQRSPMDLLNAIRPYGNSGEQDFIDLISNFLHSGRLGGLAQGFAQGSASQGSSQGFSFEQLKGFLSPEQQSRMENAQLMMQAMQQFT